MGRSKFRLTTFADTRDERIGVGLLLGGANSKSRFNLLKQQQAQIEQELGCKLEWFEMPQRKTSQIYLGWQDVDPANREKWPKQHTWFLKNL